MSFITQLQMSRNRKILKIELELNQILKIVKISNILKCQYFKNYQNFKC